MSARAADPAALLQDAMTLHRKGDLQAAERTYRAVLNVAPHHPDALHLLGTIRADLGAVAEGVNLIEKALTHLPDMGDAHYNLGNIHRRGGDLIAAERHFRRAVALQPSNPQALGNLGALLTQRQQYEEAERVTREALRLDPALPQAATTLAALHEIHGRFDQTLPIYDELLARFPEETEIHYLKALALLLRGRLTEGWQEMRWRLKRPLTRGFDGLFNIPYWQGEPLAGNRLLIWTEQGPGDELLMGTMIADAIASAAHVTLLCSPRIAPLFGRAFPSATIVAADDKPKDPSLLAGIAYQASLSELGRWLRPNLAAFPTARTYLAADRDLADRYRLNYLKARPASKLVGISWRSRNAELESEKSMALADLAGILTMPGLTFVSLQYGDCGEEIAQANRALGTSVIHDPSVDPTRDLDRFAAQTAAMDLVISVSNTTVHMAGALGRPTWAMIPANRGRMWYWFLDRDDSPWYGSVHLYRCAAGTGWNSAVDRVATDLRQWRALSELP